MADLCAVTLFSVTSAITVGFKDDSISVREDSSQLAMICIQICPGINETQQMTRRKRSIPGEQSARIGISTTQGSASGNNSGNCHGDTLSLVLYHTVLSVHNNSGSCVFGPSLERKLLPTCQ